jgi:hypothetical protein
MTVAPPPGPLPPGRRGELATAVAVAVDAVPGVDRSRSLTHSTIYPGGRVDGVRLEKDAVDVYVTMNQSAYGQPLTALGDQIRQLVDAVLRSLGDSRVSNVIIEDVLPGTPVESRVT